MRLPNFARWFLPSLNSGTFPVPVVAINTHQKGEVVAFSIKEVQIFAQEFFASRGQQIVSGTANRLFRDVFDLALCGPGKRFYALDELASMREKWLKHFPETQFSSFPDEWELYDRQPEPSYVPASPR